MTVDPEAVHRAEVVLHIRQLVAAPRPTPEWVAQAWKTLHDCDELLTADKDKPAT